MTKIVFEGAIFTAYLRLSCMSQSAARCLVSRDRSRCGMLSITFFVNFPFFSMLPSRYLWAAVSFDKNLRLDCSSIHNNETSCITRLHLSGYIYIGWFWRFFYPSDSWCCLWHAYPTISVLNRICGTFLSKQQQIALKHIMEESFSCSSLMHSFFTRIAKPAT